MRSKKTANGTHIATPLRVDHGAETPRDASLQGSGLAKDALVRKRFEKTLGFEVGVPEGGEPRILLVNLPAIHIQAVMDRTRPLLDTEVVVAPILCEAPDYVKRSLTTWLRRSVHAALVFALLNIVRDSSRTDIRSARGDYGPVIEGGAIAFRVRGQL